MEQHPVPQNVTTFQFRLIGDMTLKQFGYLLAGAILAYISYKLPLPFIFTWPLAVFFALLGIGFAFVPIEERPMDVWVLSFFKSIYSPTQYIWSRQQPRAPAASPPPKLSPGTQKSPEPPPAGTPPAAQPMHTDAFSRLRIVSMNTSGMGSLLGSFFSPKPKSKPAESLSFASVPSVVGKKVQPVEPMAPQPQAAPTPPAAPQRNTELEKRIAELETRLSQKSTEENRILDLQTQLTDLLSQKQTLEEQLMKFKKITTQAPPPDIPTRKAGVAATPPTQPTINVIAPDAATRAGIPRLTTFANVVTGIIKDNMGNLLPGVLVTVRDKNDIPLRALKTNKLGQFAASTQLPPGTYLVEIEDPRGRFVFDRAQIVVNNTVLPAIEIIAKSQKEVERARLAQQIFGDQKI